MIIIQNYKIINIIYNFHKYLYPQNTGQPPSIYLYKLPTCIPSYLKEKSLLQFKTLPCKVV